MHQTCNAFELVRIVADTLDHDLEHALRALQLPLRTASAMRAEDVLAATRSDKKARAGTVEFALVREIGVVAGSENSYGTPVADDVVLAALASALASAFTA